MEPKAPIWHHGAFADNLRVLLRDLDWGGTRKEVEVLEMMMSKFRTKISRKSCAYQNTAQSVIFKILVRSIVIVNNDIHAVGV